MKAFSLDSQFSYLGIPFSSSGLLSFDILPNFRQKLDILSKAPLKPQQRLYAVKQHILPSFLHVFCLGRVHIGTLRRVDILLRFYLRRFLHLPSDCPNSFFHATVEDGGLGVPSLRWFVPLCLQGRLRSAAKLYSSLQLSVPASLMDRGPVLHRLLQLPGGTLLQRTEDLRRFWKERLSNNVDGIGLSEASKVPAAHFWVSDGSRFLSGESYIQSIQTRINAIPFRSRLARGRIRNGRALPAVPRWNRRTIFFSVVLGRMVLGCVGITIFVPILLGISLTVGSTSLVSQ